MPTLVHRRPRHALRQLALLAGLLVVSPAAHALTLDFIGPAVTTASRSDPLTSLRLAVGPWTEAGGLPTRLVEGALDQTAWRITAPGQNPQGLTTLAIIQPLRAQLARDGFSVIFECETTACGGFDFRYGTDLLPEPDMHVDLGDFRYLAAERSSPDGPETISLMVSRSATAGFVQLTRVGKAGSPPPQISAAAPGADLALPAATAAPNDIADRAATAPPADTPAPATGLGARLESAGAVVLDGLVFPSGTADLAPGDYAALTELAAWLLANPGRQVALVGHTDAAGSLDANIALSRQRAQSVRQRLITALKVPAAQITADGAGYLAPRASNLTEAGRAANRRVEVMLTSTQ